MKNKVHSIDQMKEILARNVEAKKKQLAAMHRTLNDLVNLDNIGERLHVEDEVFDAIAANVDYVDAFDLDGSASAKTVVGDGKLEKAILNLKDALFNCWCELTEFDFRLNRFTPENIESEAIDIIDDEIHEAQYSGT